MKPSRRQRGMTFWMLLFVLVVLGTVFLFGLKLFPIYLESFKINQIIKTVAQEPGIGNLSKREITEKLVKRFDIDDVRRITERTFREYVDVDKRGDRISIAVAYRAETHLVGNLYMVAEFRKRATN